MTFLFSLPALGAFPSPLVHSGSHTCFTIFYIMLPFFLNQLLRLLYNQIFLLLPNIGLTVPFSCLFLNSIILFSFNSFLYLFLIVFLIKEWENTTYYFFNFNSKSLTIVSYLPRRCMQWLKIDSTLEKFIDFTELCTEKCFPVAKQKM